MTEDADFIEAVIHLAEMTLSSELSVKHRDDDMDRLITAARVIRDREGFYVEHSVTSPQFGRRS